MPFTPLDALEVNDAVLIPLSGARRVFDPPQPTSALVRLRPGTDLNAAGQRISAMLANPTATLQVIKAADVIKSMNAQKVIHATVARRGRRHFPAGRRHRVMNVMLMGVMERRREIGLRAAIGATPGDLGLMFLIEAAVLAFVGGMAGLACGLLAAFVTAKMSGWSLQRGSLGPAARSGGGDAGGSRVRPLSGDQGGAAESDRGAARRMSRPPPIPSPALRYGRRTHCGKSWS